MIEWRRTIGGDARELSKDWTLSDERQDLYRQKLKDVADIVGRILEECARHPLELVVTIVVSGVRHDNGSTTASVTWQSEAKGKGGK